MKRARLDGRPSAFQLILSTAKANGAEYRGDELPANNWRWPTETWLQRRLRELRRQREGGEK